MKEDIAKMLREAVEYADTHTKDMEPDDDQWFALRDARFAALVAAAERNKLAQWMIDRSYATGHGDTTEDLLKELEWQVRESEREACAKVVEASPSYDWHRFACEAAAAIRARGQDPMPLFDDWGMK
jgi:hypothetical protein